MTLYINSNMYRNCICHEFYENHINAYQLHTRICLENMHAFVCERCKILVIHCTEEMDFPPSASKGY